MTTLVITSLFNLKHPYSFCNVFMFLLTVIPFPQDG